MTLRTAIEDRVQDLAMRKRVRRVAALERKRTGMLFDPTAHVGDPYPHYATFRERDPVHHHPLIDGFVLTRHEDCLAAIRDPRFTSDSRAFRGFERLVEQHVRNGGDPGSFENPSMLNLDGPAHDRLRSLVSKGFTPRAIERLAPRIESIAGELLDEVRPGAVFDWMETVAHPMPSVVIAEILGVPKEDRARFQAWSRAIMAGGSLDAPAARRRGNRAMTELVVYLVEIIKRRRDDPGPDILSALIRAEEEDGDRLKFAELIATSVLLLVAGHAGTSAMIGNGLLTLLRFPEQLSRLRENPGLWPTAIEEALRFEGAVQGMIRMTTEELRIHGKRIRKGQTVMLLVASANRDPEVFEEPDRFDIARNPNPHLAFGRGHHFCLGASLARLEMRIALSVLLERFAGLEMAARDVEWSPSGMRSLMQLPLRGTQLSSRHA